MPRALQSLHRAPARVGLLCSVLGRRTDHTGLAQRGDVGCRVAEAGEHFVVVFAELGGSLRSPSHWLSSVIGSSGTVVARPSGKVSSVMPRRYRSGSAGRRASCGQRVISPVPAGAASRKSILRLASAAVPGGECGLSEARASALRCSPPAARHARAAANVSLAALLAKRQSCRSWRTLPVDCDLDEVQARTCRRT